jgi:hypothetical protein
VEFSAAPAGLTIPGLITLAAAALILCAWIGEAAAWSDLGHQAIALAAEQRLEVRTKAAIARAAGMTTYTDGALARMSTWPDDIRRLKGGGPSPLDDDEIREAEAFMAKFPDHPTWHYVNLPLGRPYPARRDRYTRPNDVVGALLRCIDVLEGRAATFSKAIALRFLVHLVGDLHQPLHVGSGYFDIRDPSSPRLIHDPDGKRRVVPDLGGNRVAFRNANLHATWDTGVVVALGTADPKSLATSLLRDGAPSARLSGDYRSWPRTWASESSRIAAEVAYRPLRFGEARLKPHDPDRTPGGPQLDTIAIDAPSYEQYVKAPATRNAARTQLARAAFRLADLLNGLRWR